MKPLKTLAALFLLAVLAVSDAGAQSAQVSPVTTGSRPVIQVAARTTKVARRHRHRNHRHRVQRTPVVRGRRAF